MNRDHDHDHGARPRSGLGLPAAIPDAPGRATVEWASLGEDLGFASLGVIDRLVYDNYDPFVALAAAAAVTDHAELFTTVLNVPWRQSALMLAKQLWSLERISGGRLIAGLALGGWPEDYRESGIALTSRRAVFDDMPDADATADEYIHHYYGDEFFGAARADVLTTPGHLHDELQRLRDAGCDDVLLFPCSADLDQPRRLAVALKAGQ